MLPQKAKYCRKCNILKPLSAFPDQVQGIAGKHSYCRKCHTLRMKEYYHSKEGILNYMFNRMKERTNGNYRLKTYNARKLLFSKQEFIDFAFQNKSFHKLYDYWKDSGFCRAYAPSIDRINNLGDYCLLNIQFLTNRENCSKGNRARINRKLSKYVGVTWRKDLKCYRARIIHKTKTICLGNYKDEEEAARAVNRKCIELGILVRNPKLRKL